MQQKRLNRQCLWAGGMLVIFVGLASFLYINQKEVKKREAIEQRMVVATQPMRSGINRPVLSLYGYVVVPKPLEISSLLQGEIAKVSVSPGQRVQKGQWLLAIDASEYDRRYREALTQKRNISAQIEGEKTAQAINQEALQQEEDLLILSQKRFKRQQSLAEQGAVAQIVLENSEKEFKQHQIEVSRRQALLAEHQSSMRILRLQQEATAIQIERAQEDLTKTKIEAPVSGVVSEVNVTEGSQVSGQTLVGIIPDGQYEIHAQIPAKYTAEIKNSLQQGQELPAIISMDTGDIPVRLEKLLPTVKEGQMGQQAVLGFINQEDSEMFAHKMPVLLRVSLTEVANSYVVEQSALYPNDTVYIVDENSALRAVSVNRRGFLYQDGQAKILITATDVIEDRDLMLTHIPNPTEGLSVKKYTGDQ